MVGVVLFSRKCHINPDNVATPIAASLGDITTLSLLSAIGYILYKEIGEFQWHSQNAEKVTHIKGRLLDQTMILFNYFPFQNGNFS